MNPGSSSTVSAVGSAPSAATMTSAAPTASAPTVSPASAPASVEAVAAETVAPEPKRPERVVVRNELDRQLQVYLGHGGSDYGVVEPHAKKDFPPDPTLAEWPVMFAERNGASVPLAKLPVQKNPGAEFVVYSGAPPAGSAGGKAIAVNIEDPKFGGTILRVTNRTKEPIHRIVALPWDGARVDLLAKKKEGGFEPLLPNQSGVYHLEKPGKYALRFVTKDGGRWVAHPDDITVEPALELVLTPNKANAASAQVKEVTPYKVSVLVSKVEPCRKDTLRAASNPCDNISNSAERAHCERNTSRTWGTLGTGINCLE
jgi:hypothetical protein